MMRKKIFNKKLKSILYFMKRNNYKNIILHHIKSTISCFFIISFISINPSVIVIANSNQKVQTVYDNNDDDKYRDINDESFIVPEIIFIEDENNINNDSNILINNDNSEENINVSTIDENSNNIELNKIIIDEKYVPNWEKDCKSYNFTYMDYKMITCKTAPQYYIVNSDNAYTDEITGLRICDNRICVAIGSGYGYVVGDYIDVTLENGNTFECIIGDEKDDDDTDSSNKFHSNDGSVIEMIIDNNYFYSTSQYPEGFYGNVEKISKVIYE